MPSANAATLLAQSGKRPHFQRQLLHHMQGLGLGTKEDAEVERAAKRARVFMQDFAALPLDSLSPEQAIAQSQSLYQQLMADAASMPTLRRLIEV